MLSLSRGESQVGGIAGGDVDEDMVVGLIGSGNAQHARRRGLRGGHCCV